MGFFKPISSEIFVGFTQIIDLYLHTTFNFFASNVRFLTLLCFLMVSVVFDPSRSFSGRVSDVSASAQNAASSFPPQRARAPQWGLSRVSLFLQYHFRTAIDNTLIIPLQITAAAAQIFETLPPLSLNPSVNLNGADTLYGLVNRIIACESLFEGGKS